MKLPIAFLAALGLVSASPISLRPRASQCNGSSDNCDLKWSNISYIGTHDSAFVGSLTDPSVNQVLSVTDQLDAGIRFLQGQTHKNFAGDISMCHTSCAILDAGTLQSYLSTVKSWLDANPDAVLTLLLTNGDNLKITEFDPVFQASGIKPYTFVPSTSPNKLAIQDWPTLGEMISDGSRLVVFMDYGADESEVNYIMEEWHYFFETPFDTTDPGFNECSLNRPPGASPDGRMYIINHFLDQSVLGALIPDNGRDFKTNAATGFGSIGNQVARCYQNWGREPKFVLVDMFNRGDVFAAQQAINGN